jgi:uncharacterized damage-inducible protein DinB
VYRKIADFQADWVRESAGTLKILRALTDASLGQAVTPGGRTLGRIAWHVALTLGEMGGRAGLPVEGPPEDAPQPATAAEIAAAYEKAARSLAAAVGQRWTDAALGDKLEMYGQTWTKAETLAGLVRHEIHHRAQLTVLMRQAGLAVPGVYGPAREEWSAYGMPPQD